MRRSHWAVLTGLLLLGGIGYFVGLKVVESVVLEKLTARGFDATVGSVRLWPFAVRLSDVTATHRSGVLSVSFPQLRADLGLSGIRRLRVLGGEVSLDGDVNRVRSALLGEAKADVTPSPARRGVTVEGEQLLVRWAQPLGAGSSVALTDVTFTRTQGELDVSVGQVDVRRVGALARFSRLVSKIDERELAVETLQATSGEVSVDLDAWSAGGEWAPPALAPPAGAPAVKPTVGRQRNKQGAVEPALAWFSLDPRRGEHWRRLVKQGAGMVARRLPASGALELSHTVLSVRRREQSLTIGPGTIYARRDEDRVQFGFSSGANQGQTALEMHVSAPLLEGPVEARLKGGPVSLATLGVKPGNFGLQELDRTQLTVDAQLTLSADGGVVEFSSLGDVRDMAVQQERLAPYALTEIDLGWSVSGRLLVDGSDILLKAGRLEFGKVSGVADVHLAREAERLRLDADFTVAEGSCEAMFEALPRGSVPLLAGARLTGNFRWHGGIHLDTDHLAQTRATWNMRNQCRFTDIPNDAHPDQFRTRFSLYVPDYDGQPMTFRTGPGSAQWASLEEISPFMVTAVLTTEDGGFWTHHGFDSSAIEGAIRRNLEKREFSRGASTISMQLAKNLYLERDKYIARKVQEALLTMLLEQELRKKEILELYLNVIEYGPGVYGIRQAARHYFGSTPSELSVAQCFFLASILPRPKAQYFDESGRLVTLRANLVRNLMKIAHERRRLSKEDLDQGLEEELRFGVPSLDSNPYRTPSDDLRSHFPDGEPTDEED